MKHLALLALIIFVGSCSVQIEEKFVNQTAITLLPDPDNEKHVFYRTYKTGIDNYKFVFYIARIDKDTVLSERIQTIYLNDANLTNFNFLCSTDGDTVTIKSSKPTIAKTDVVQYENWIIAWKFK